MGTEMVETRFPVLNIIDAIWVNANPLGGPITPYDEATRANVIAASLDPVALDYWAAKHILVQAAQKTGRTHASWMDPDNMSSPGSFGQWLRLSMQEINQAGYQTTVDEARMNVYVSQLQLPSSPAPPPSLAQPPTQAPQPSPTTTHRGMNWVYLTIILAGILVALMVGIVVVRKKSQGSNS
jgi:hypothetical protein